MSNRTENYFLKKKLGLIVFLLLFIFLIFRLRNYPGFTEKYYALEIYPFIRKNFLVGFNWLPISFGDILYILGIIVITLTLIRTFRFAFINKRFRSAGLTFMNLIAGVEIALIVFYLFWGLNYFREPVAQRLGISDSSYTEAELIRIGTMLIDSVNSKRAVLSPGDFERTNDRIYATSVQAALEFSKISKTFKASKPLAKSSLLSHAMNFIGTAGYFNSFTGEAQINSLMPTHLRPFVACHEIAHQSGIGGEDEANFFGFLMGIQSGDNFLQYSSYYLAMQEFMSEIRRTDSLTFNSLKSRISVPVIADLKTETEYWSKYRGIMSKITSIFYDNYLKANKQEEGLNSYNKMVVLSMAYYKQQGKFNTSPKLFP